MKIRNPTAKWTAQSPARLISLVRAGIPYSRLAEFQYQTGMEWEMVGRLVRIPSRTLARRRKLGRLSFDESERLLRLCRVFAAAVELFHGNHAEALQWMSAPQRAFDGETPFDYATTETGAREVETLVGRLQHGVFT